MLKARFIEEVPHTTWLGNVIMVKKANGSCRMCVDFADLNKACLKDSYPFPNIVNFVDATLGYTILSFYDAFFECNQILMLEEDCLKMAFIMDEGGFCYKIMPFGLKNAEATYRRMINKVFKD